MPELEQTKNNSKVDSEKSTDFEKLVNLTTLLGKTFFSVGVIIYAMGFLATNLYFCSYGISAISLLKSNYFITGIWVLLPLLELGCLISMISYLAIFREYAIEKMSSFSYRLLMSILMAFLAFSFGFLYGYLGIDMTFGWLYVCLAAALVVICVGLYLYFYDVITMKYMITTASNQRIIRYIMGFYVPIAVGIALMIGYVLEFAKYMYPSIPSYLGGAKPIAVQIYIDPNSVIKDSFSSCGLHEQKDGSWEGVLVLASESEYYLAVKEKPEILCVEKQYIKTIRYMPYLGKEGKAYNNKQ